MSTLQIWFVGLIGWLDRQVRDPLALSLLKGQFGRTRQRLNRAGLALAAWCNWGGIQPGIVKFGADLPQHQRQSVSWQVAQNDGV